MQLFIPLAYADVVSICETIVFYSSVLTEDYPEDSWRPYERYSESIPVGYSGVKRIWWLMYKRCGHVLPGASPGCPLPHLVVLIWSATPEAIPWVLYPTQPSCSRMDMQLETINPVEPGLPSPPARDSEKTRKCSLCPGTRKMPALLWWSESAYLETWMNVWG